MSGRIIDLDGPVHLVEHGGHGPPMLLVHGLGGSHLDWQDVTEGLGRHHTVYALDLIGFGRTPVAGRKATVGDNVRLVSAALDHIAPDERVTLVGNSMGGLISTVVAAKRPSRVSSLVLVDPAMPRSRGGRLSPMLFLTFAMVATPGVGGFVVSRGARRSGVERLVDDALRLCTVDSSRIAPATRQAHIELATWRTTQDDPYGAFVQASRSLIRWLWDWRYIGRFVERVKAPTLLLHGERDKVVPIAAAREAARRRPDWTFEVIPDVGHVPQMECPAEFLAIVDRWLATTAAGKTPKRKAAAAR